MRSLFSIAGEYLHKAFRQKDGALSRQLLLEPGRFGLGKTVRSQTPDATTTLVCGYCSTGCGLRLHLKDGAAVNLSPDSDYVVNQGMACPKGWEALTPMEAPDRLRQPRIRTKEGWRDCSWHEAMEHFTHKLKTIRAQHGPEAAAYLSTGQMCTEEMFLLGVIWKFGMGFIHGDANTRQCMATSHVAYKQAFGFDAPPFTYQDFEESDSLIFMGANPCIAHPILWERVLKNKRDARIAVIDPRRTETAMASHLHLPLRPKSDLTLLYGVARELLRRGWIREHFIERHTEGFEAFRADVESFDAEKVTAETGLDWPSIERLVEMFRLDRKVSIWWTMGVNQSHQGVRTAQAIINLCLMTGNIGKPGTGPNSITGQMNAMGSRILSNQTSLPGGRDPANAEHRREIANLLDLPYESIPSQTTKAYDEILDDIDAGKIKALWVVGTNPAHSWIRRKHFRQAAENLDFLVVQDLYGDTETAKMSHMVLPAAGWAEKEGTVINSERRIGLFKKVKKAPGQALADFYIFKLAAKYWGCENAFMDMADPESTFQVMKKVTQGRPCDFSGIHDYADIDRAGGIQWPYPSENPDSSPERRLFRDGKFYRENGRALFLFDAPRPMSEQTDGEYPLALSTGRGTSAQWHTGTRTGRSAILRKLYSQEAYMEIHPTDARHRGLREGDWALIVSRRGSMRAKAVFSSGLRLGEIFVPMHYEECNQLTYANYDPHSRQPGYKSGAVEVRLLGGLERPTRSGPD